MKKIMILICFLIIPLVSYGQENPLKRINFIIGNWSGTGSGFGNEASVIESNFQYIMDKKYIEIVNESRFEPTDKKPEGEHHIDKGFISFDKMRKVIVFRQFNNEGYVNQYVLNDSLSTETVLIFETEKIENFMPGGKARWTIKRISDDQIETIFDVYFPGKDYTCVGVNKLMRNNKTY